MSFCLWTRNGSCRDATLLWTYCVFYINMHLVALQCRVYTWHHPVKWTEIEIKTNRTWKRRAVGALTWHSLNRFMKINLLTSLAPCRCVEIVTRPSKQNPNQVSTFNWKVSIRNFQNFETCLLRQCAFLFFDQFYLQHILSEQILSQF